MHDGPARDPLPTSIVVGVALAAAVFVGIVLMLVSINWKASSTMDGAIVEPPTTSGQK
jgi:hypothetical protein